MVETRTFKEKYFGPSSFYKQVFFIAMPVMLQQLIQGMVSLIDNFMVSGLGDVPMSGVNIVGQIVFVFTVFVGSITVSGGIFMSQFYGANDKEGMKQAFRFKLTLGGIAMILYLLCSWVMPEYILHFMVIGNADANEILTYAVQYMKILGFMGLPMLISMVISSSMREIGQVKMPLYISVGATVINTVLNWILIYGHLGAPKLGVRGAAIATVVARLSEMTAFLFIYYKKKYPFFIRLPRLFKINGEIFKHILKKSVIIIFGDMTWAISDSITVALYNTRGGADVVSGMASSFTIANLFFVAFEGINTATGVILGKELGAGNLEEAKVKKNWLLTAAVFFGIFMTGFGALTSLLVPVVFVNLSAAAIAISRRMVMMLALFMVVWVYENVQQSISRAGGDILMSLVCDAGITIVGMVPTMFFLALCTDLGPVPMYFIMKLFDVLKLISFAIWLTKERWVKNLTVTDPNS